MGLHLNAIQKNAQPKLSVCSVHGTVKKSQHVYVEHNGGGHQMGAWGFQCLVISTCGHGQSIPLVIGSLIAWKKKAHWSTMLFFRFSSSTHSVCEMWLLLALTTHWIRRCPLHNPMIVHPVAERKIKIWCIKLVEIKICRLTTFTDRIQNKRLTAEMVCRCKGSLRPGAHQGVLCGSCNAIKVPILVSRVFRTYGGTVQQEPCSTLFLRDHCACAPSEKARGDGCTSTAMQDLCKSCLPCVHRA